MRHHPAAPPRITRGKYARYPTGSEGSEVLGAVGGAVGTAVAVSVGVAIGVLVGVLVGVAVGVLVGVLVGVSIAKPMLLTVAGPVAELA